jgi:hypothetical protein
MRFERHGQLHNNFETLWLCVSFLKWFKSKAKIYMFLACCSL